ncbi:Cof-type HAD-IIB family hydrolase [Paenibacillus sp. P96]|uniref:Cof-type HAD-IIB family hydrolase n=1 Tax=Paenibacillus zeirhizosphaerae TaxID=2987519 RepID=A0ABT9FUY2_9BACL|nr:Cof-type HAD-IIB family hydrolase [Paenibacillus sp. P96]MDP4098541.1 Cof-type HAD-IIB family hydrolase [Paenibacillus sp. P96]
MKYKAVFFDIDGTLVNEEKQIPQDTIDAIRELREKDIPVFIATGRAPYYFTHYADQLGIDSFVSFNGSYVEYKGQPVYERAISKETLERLETLALSHNHPIVMQGSQAGYANFEDHEAVAESFYSLRVEVPGYRTHYWKEASVYQALLYCQEQEEHIYTSAETPFDDLHFVRWHRVAMDVIPAGGSKAKGIEAVLKHLGIKREEAVAFGDGLNDKEMLSYVGLGIAMGNAHEEVKPFAKYVTHSVDEGGIRHGLQYAGLL